MKNAERIINLPFSGFYESLWSDGLEREQEQFLINEYENGSSDYTESAFPESCQISEEDLGELLSECQNWRESCLAIAREYPNQLAARLPVKIELKFRRLESPRFYNFRTDEIDANISFRDVVNLFRASRDNKHDSLKRVIERRHTSRSGFYSYYSNDLETWLEKPLIDWDHNELCTLLIAVHEIENEADSLCHDVFDAWPDGLYQEWEAGIDWPKFERLRAEKRREIAEKFATDNWSNIGNALQGVTQFLWAFGNVKPWAENEESERQRLKALGERERAQWESEHKAWLQSQGMESAI